MKVDSFDTHFKSNSSSIGNVVGLLGIELTVQTGLLGIELTAQTGLLGIELTSPSMTIKASGLLTALGMLPSTSPAQSVLIVLSPPVVVRGPRLFLDSETICSLSVLHPSSRHAGVYD